MQEPFCDHAQPTIIVDACPPKKKSRTTRYVHSAETNWIIERTLDNSDSEEYSDDDGGEQPPVQNRTERKPPLPSRGGGSSASRETERHRQRTANENREAEDLLPCPWNPVCISGQQLLAKARFGDTAYHVLLTDMNGVWEEKVDAVAIQRRAQELNKRLRAPVKAFFSHLRDVARPCLMGGGPAEGAAQVSVVRQAGRHLDVKLKSELAGLPFYWEFRCTSAPVTMVCSQLVRPLLLMSRLLQGQVEHMGGLLLRKDAEIQDYRENGATLSRERLQTEVFDEQAYGQNFIRRTLPELHSSQQVGFGFVDDLQALYGTVVDHGRTATRKRKLSGESLTEESRRHPPGGSPAVAPPTQKDRDVDRTPSTGGSSVSAEPGEGNGLDHPVQMSDTQQQSCPEMTDPETGSPLKPKKKKGKGLFR